MQSQHVTNPTQRPVVLFSLIIMVVVLLTLTADYAASRWQREEQKTAVNQQLSALRAALEFELYTNIELIRGAAAYVSLNPDLNQQGFSLYMSRLLEQRNNIINIAGARDLVVSLIYPVEGNEKVLGLNYRVNEAQRDSVFKALDIGTTILTGPVDLVQGGVGFIARIPVVNENGIWGILSVVLDYQEVLREAGFIDQQTLDLVISGHNAQGQLIDVFRDTGSRELQQPVRLSIQLPYGQWQLAAQPKDGWINFTLHPLSWVMALIIGTIACYIAQLRLNNRLLQQDTLSALKLSERKFRQFFSAHAVVMLIIDEHGQIVEANRAAVNYYGYSAEQMSAMSVVDIQTMDRDSVMRHIKRSMVERSSKYAVQHRLASGEIRDVELLNTTIESNGRQLIYTIVIDTTERLEYQKRWELSQQVFNHSLEGIIVTDATLNIISVNPAFSDITGYQEEEVLGKKPDFLGSDLYERSFIEQMQFIITETGFWRGEVWSRRKNGSVFPQLLSISVVKDDVGAAVNYLAVFSDITSLKQSEEKLERLAHYDALTGLPNRVQFQLHLQHTVSLCQEVRQHCALLYLDLDRFKVVNDSLGHAAGDELLRMVTERLSLRLRSSDLLARMGGDEFVLLVEDYKHDSELEVLARKLIDEMNQPFYLVGEHEVNVGGSVGIARYPADAANSEDLLVRADAAMYKAKQAGGSKLAFFTSDILVEASSRLTIASELKRAVAENELELYLQPQIDGANGAVVGAEALLRWNHPVKGFLTPDSFIDVAEQTRAIRLVTGWLVKEVFGIIERWQTQYPQLFISFNVSALDLADNELLRRMTEVLADHPIDTSRIELEIVESAIIENFESASSILVKLRKLGFCVAIDDFGTGYSSLAYLDKLPVDKLKIDREFISKLGEGEQSGVVKSIIDLAGNFGLRVVAEGVETAEQEHLLKAMGCNRVQGYYYSKPLPMSEFEAKYLTL
ncbi:bifunctional diguanylate cyclase/phosphodiesterase [Alteromonas gilva]|uniref:EAL domain-containing protein n=1 Tax=Alteromonas gilva TaxID=2987522 RepID=A0ABT5L3X9_9ALTE|nr:EAL domain-containing protein [Alteromonas gilva]MDC8831754.1 EAL domain-containing protein [Alteromonas gilva]